MKKGLTIIAIALFLGVSLLSSCGQRQLCPAYTDNIENIDLTEVDA